jgi:hypothetical protein
MTDSDGRYVPQGRSAVTAFILVGRAGLWLEISINWHQSGGGANDMKSRAIIEQK